MLLPVGTFAPLDVLVLGIAPQRLRHGSGETGIGSVTRRQGRGELMSASQGVPNARTLGSCMLAATPSDCQLLVRRVPRLAM